MNRVVVLVGPTRSAKRATEIAITVATKLGRPLAMMTANSTPFDTFAQARHEDLIANHAGIEAESILIEASGSDSTAILGCLSRADIVVMATDHISVLGELLEGSVFMNLAQRFDGVMIAVGPHAEMPSDADTMLLCFDHQSNQHVRLLTNFADPMGLTTELVSVVEPTKSHGRELLGDVPDSAELRSVANRMKQQRGEAHDVAHDISWDVLYGDATSAILSQAKRPRVAAVGIVTMGFGPMARLISPSLMNNLLHECQKPIVLIHDAPKKTSRMIGARAIGSDEYYTGSTNTVASL